MTPPNTIAHMKTDVLNTLIRNSNTLNLIVKHGLHVLPPSKRCRGDSDWSAAFDGKWFTGRSIHAAVRKAASPRPNKGASRG